MFDLRMVDVAISLALVYMMMAGIVSGLQEWLSNFLDLRGRHLMKGLASLLHQEAQHLQLKKALVQREAAEQALTAQARADWLANRQAEQLQRAAQATAPTDTRQEPDLGSLLASIPAEPPVDEARIQAAAAPADATSATEPTQPAIDPATPLEATPEAPSEAPPEGAPTAPSAAPQTPITAPTAPAREVYGAEPPQADDFYMHPLINALRDGQRLPSYIPPATFALVFADTLVQRYNPELAANRSTPLSADEHLLALRDTVAKIPPYHPLRRSLEVILANVPQRAEAIQHALELHYGRVMDRVSGWYKRHVQKLAFVIALAITVALNVDTLAIVQHLNTHPASAAALADKVEVRLAQLTPEQTAAAAALPPASAASTTLGDLRKQVADLHDSGLPMGWQGLASWYVLPPSQWHTPDWAWWHNFLLRWEVLIKLLGWFITAAAATLGAPFWFDLLSRMVSLRSAGKEAVAALQPPPPPPAAGQPPAPPAA